MTERKIYTATEREEAIAYAQQHTMADAARKLGIPKGNISRWMRDAGLDAGGNSPRTARAVEAARAKRLLLREKLRTRLLDRAMYALDRMDKPHVELRAGLGKVTLPTATDGGVQSLALAAAVLIDKYRLELGEATSRGEHRDLTNDDHEAGLLRDAITGELARRHAQSAGAPLDRAATPGADEAPVEADSATRAGAPE